MTGYNRFSGTKELLPFPVGGENMTTIVQVTLPEDLVSQARQFVGEGWVADFDELLAESLRRYLESHGPALTEAFLREDVAWGLDGQD
jgi:hypothetical protein